MAADGILDQNFMSEKVSILTSFWDFWLRLKLTVDKIGVPRISQEQPKKKVNETENFAGELI